MKGIVFVELLKMAEDLVGEAAVDAGQSLTPPAAAAPDNVLRFRW